jgi:alanyl-tRNA synthetase
MGSRVKLEPIVPKGTAFEDGLYETHGLPPEQAKKMERDFMAKIDNDAARALEVIDKETSHEEA